MDVVTRDTDLPRPAPRPETPEEDDAAAIEELSLLGLTPRPVPEQPDHDLRHALPLQPEAYFDKGQGHKDGRDDA